MSLLNRKIVNHELKNYKKVIVEMNTLNIPKFQRNYSWKKENFEDFLNDIFNLINSKEISNFQRQLFFGILFFVKRENEEFDIIDGQQRLTTLLLIKFIILKEVLKNESINGGQEDNFKVKYVINFFQDYTNVVFQKRYLQYKNFNELKSEIDEQFILKAKESFKFKILNKDGNHSFLSLFDNEEKINYEEKYPKSFIEIREIIKNKIKEEFTLINKLDIYHEINDIIDEKINFLILTIDENEDYFSFFRDLNSKGIDLNTFDYVNLYMMNYFDKLKIRDYKLNKEFIDLCDEIQNFYKMAGKSENIKKYYEFWKSSLYAINESYFDKTKNNDNPFPKIEYFKKGHEEKWFEDFLLSKEKSDDEKISILKDLMISIKFLKDIDNEELICETYIKLLNRKQVYPILIALRRKDYNNNEIEKIMDKIINVSFIKLTFQKLSPGDFKKEALNFVKAINKNENLNYKKIFNVREMKKEDYEIFIKNRNDINIPIFNNKQLLYIHLRQFYMSENSELLNLKIDEKDLTLEHCIPLSNRNLSESNKLEYMKDTIVSTMFLPFKVNNKLRDKSPIEKLTYLVDNYPKWNHSNFKKIFEEKYNINSENYNEKYLNELDRMMNLKFLEI